VLSCESVKAAVGHGTGAARRETAPAPAMRFPTPLPLARELELALVRESLQRTKGNRKLAAEMIGMARQTFNNKLKELEGAGQPASPQ